MTATAGVIINSALTATGGTGTLYGGSPTSVLVASLVSNSSITYTVTGGTTPTAGTVTNILTTGATNVTADGGGLTLKGTTDKTFNWINSTSAWTSSEHINLASGKNYLLNGTNILSSVTYVGTTSVALNRASAAQSLTGITSIDGYAAGLAGGNATTLLGALPYQSAANTTSLLGPNTTATKKFLTETGDGTNGAAPVWGVLVAGDIPSYYIGTTSITFNRSSATQSLTGVNIDGSAGSAGSATKATNLVGGNATTLLGALPYQSNTDTTTLLSPNTTSTKKFLRMTGDGTNGAAPA
jgi:hypothetical protein